jgi:hypothetical protein
LLGCLKDEWHYNNTLNKLTKTDKPNTTQYYVYDYQGNQVRSVIESDRQMQCVVFAAFAKDVGADVQGGALLFCLVV